MMSINSFVEIKSLQRLPQCRLAIYAPAVCSRLGHRAAGLRAIDEVAFIKINFEDRMSKMGRVLSSTTIQSNPYH